MLESKDCCSLDKMFPFANILGLGHWNVKDTRADGCAYILLRSSVRDVREFEKSVLNWMWARIPSTETSHFNKREVDIYSKHCTIRYLILRFTVFYTIVEHYSVYIETSHCWALRCMKTEWRGSLMVHYYVTKVSRWPGQLHKHSIAKQIWIIAIRTSICLLSKAIWYWMVRN